ncbi:hypothetical protein KY304_01135 [Candidatus Woesearchaeota archaeon]|nr:hypothetical protein [Candidatus Woesearchaeota archaeon]MBW2978698.1 hypothetical protein [Candidatus Woesearchaeota archaeon]
MNEDTNEKLDELVEILRKEIDSNTIWLSGFASPTNEYKKCASRIETYFDIIKMINHVFGTDYKGI